MYNPDRGFEGSAIDRADRSLRRGMGREAVDFILENEIVRRPKIDEFSDIFPQEEIEQDKRDLQSRKDGWEEQLRLHLERQKVPPQEQEEIREKIRVGKRKSEALEVVIARHGELYNWFGEDAGITRATEFDDVFNGVDAVLVFDLGEGSEETIALAIDASMNPDVKSIQGKIKRNQDKLLNRAEQAKVKYFRSKHQRGILQHVIPVVVGMEGKNSEKLFSLVANVMKLERRPGSVSQTLSQLKTELEVHPAQKIFLEEIVLQLRGYMQMLKGNPREESLRERITVLQMVLREVIQSKQDIELEEFGNDMVLDTIRRIVHNEVGSK